MYLDVREAIDGLRSRVSAMPADGMPVATTAASSQATFAPETALGRWWFSIAASAVFGALLSWQLVFRPLLAAAIQRLCR